MIITLPLLALFVINDYCRWSTLRVATHYATSIQPPLSVHIGDSITAGGGDWSWVLWSSPFRSINLAGNGYTIEQVYHQAQVAVRYSPKYICVMAGTNDVFDSRYNVEFSQACYEKIFREIADADIICVVTLVPYARDLKDRERIKLLNERIRELGLKYKATIIDLNPQIAPTGNLLSKYTIDGVHFTDQAYSVWAKMIRNSTSI